MLRDSRHRCQCLALSVQDALLLRSMLLDKVRRFHSDPLHGVQIHFQFLNFHGVLFEAVLSVSGDPLEGSLVLR